MGMAIVEYRIGPGPAARFRWVLLVPVLLAVLAFVFGMPDVKSYVLLLVGLSALTLLLLLMAGIQNCRGAFPDRIRHRKPMVSW